MNSQPDHPDRVRQRDLPLDGWTARSMRQSDAASVLELLRDPDVARARTASPPRDEAEADEWIRGSADHDDLRWVIERNEDGQFGGIVVLQAVRREGDAAEAGYLLLPGARGLGLATAALAAATEFAFGRLHLDRVWLVHDVDNPASCLVAQRAGFRSEGAGAPRRRVDGTSVAQEVHARYREDPPSLPPDDRVPS
jgi:RimJ/RimL family protein N-acetyltransferase